MEAPHPQQLGREDEDEVAAGKQAFAEYTAVADQVHAAVRADDAEGRAAQDAVQVRASHLRSPAAATCLWSPADRWPQFVSQSFAATAAELDKLLADESSDDDDWLARRRAAAQEEQDMPEPEPEQAPKLERPRPAEPQAASAQSPSATREQIEALYRMHNPDKLPQLDDLCAKYGEESLLKMVTAKYATPPSTVPVAEVSQGLRMIQQVYSLAPMLLGGKTLPTQCSPQLRLFFEGAEEALLAAMSNQAAGGQDGSNTIGSVPGAWLGVLAKLEAALEISTATRVLVRRHDNGFFANFLQVVDALAASITALAPHEPGAAGREGGVAGEVVVDWTLDGTEEHFTYGQIGTNVWVELFEPITQPCSAETGPDQDAACEAATQPVMLGRRLNMLLCSVYRGMTTGEDGGGSSYFASHRQQYSVLCKTHIKVRHPAVLKAVEAGKAALNAAANAELGEQKRAYRLAVHKRVSTPAVINAQTSNSLPPTSVYIAAAQTALAERGGEEGSGVIWLASDDNEAVDAFQAAFGDRCIVREGVKRTNGGVCEDGRSNEVHNLAGGATVEDAADVLIDAMMMSECDECLHADSNVTIAAAIFNPTMRMTHILQC
jgi:hypothetical protein